MCALAQSVTMCTVTQGSPVQLQQVYFFVDLLLFYLFCSLTIKMILKGAPFIYIYCYRGIDCE